MLNCLIDFKTNLSTIQEKPGILIEECEIFITVKYQLSPLTSMPI